MNRQQLTCTLEAALAADKERESKWRYDMQRSEEGRERICKEEGEFGERLQGKRPNLLRYRRLLLRLASPLEFVPADAALPACCAAPVRAMRRCGGTRTTLADAGDALGEVLVRGGQLGHQLVEGRQSRESLHAVHLRRDDKL